MCSSPWGPRIVRGRAAWHLGRCGLSWQDASSNAADEPCRRTPCGTTEDVIGEGGYFQKRIDGGQEGNKEDGEGFQELDGRNSALRLKVHDSKNEVCDYIHHGRRDDLIESVLNETAQPTPEQPLQFRDDKKRNENRPDQNANGGSDKSESDYNDSDGLGCSEQNDDDHIDDSSKHIRKTRRIHPNFEVGDALLHRSKFGLINLVGQELGLIGNEIVETGAHTWNG